MSSARRGFAAHPKYAAVAGRRLGLYGWEPAAGGAGSAADGGGANRGNGGAARPHASRLSLAPGAVSPMAEADQQQALQEIETQALASA